MKDLRRSAITPQSLEAVGGTAVLGGSRQSRHSWKRNAVKFWEAGEEPGFACDQARSATTAGGVDRTTGLGGSRQNRHCGEPSAVKFLETGEEPGFAGDEMTLMAMGNDAE